MRKKVIPKTMSVIQQLIANRDEINTAIAVLEKLEQSGMFADSVQPKLRHATSSIANLSVYEGAIAILRQNNKPMRMPDIVSGILESGKKITSKVPKSTVSSTIHKAVKDKKDCNIVRLKGGLWGLREWK